MICTMYIVIVVPTAPIYSIYRGCLCHVGTNLLYSSPPLSYIEGGGEELPQKIFQGPAGVTAFSFKRFVSRAGHSHQGPSTRQQCENKKLVHDTFLGILKYGLVNGLTRRNVALRRIKLLFPDTNRTQIKFTLYQRSPQSPLPPLSTKVIMEALHAR